MMALSEELLASLREAAKRAALHSYSPYSRFPVGAAVLTSDDKIYASANVENASFGLTVCAERNAIFRAVSSGSHKLLAVVVYTPTALPTTPCGACRQVIREFAEDVPIICVADGDTTIVTSLGELLPKAFGPANL